MSSQSDQSKPQSNPQSNAKKVIKAAVAQLQSLYSCNHNPHQSYVHAINMTSQLAGALQVRPNAVNLNQVLANNMLMAYKLKYVNVRVNEGSDDGGIRICVSEILSGRA